jgi:hypothetical protein
MVKQPCNYRRYRGDHYHPHTSGQSSQDFSGDKIEIDDTGEMSRLGREYQEKKKATARIG